MSISMQREAQIGVERLRVTLDDSAGVKTGASFSARPSPARARPGLGLGLDMRLRLRAWRNALAALG